MITQVKMLHDPHPVADLLGQISRSNAGSKLSVKIAGRICRSNSRVKSVRQFAGQIASRNHGSNCWVKLLVESVRRIAGSNRSVKFLDQIPRSNCWVKLPCNARRYIRNARRYIKCTRSNAANPWLAAGKPRRMHEHAYGQAENGLGWAGKGQRKRPRFVGAAFVGLALFDHAFLSAFAMASRASFARCVRAWDGLLSGRQGF